MNAARSFEFPSCCSGITAK